MFTENLSRHYGSSVAFRNPSLGGKDTVWAIENARGFVYPYNPDLVIIAFGMNDGIHMPPEQFAENIKEIMNIIREHSSETEFILVATSLPNKLTLTNEHTPFYNYQYSYKEALDELETTGVAVTNMRDMHLALLEHKRFVDLTGNNVNHPNDFFARCYAQLLSAMLINQENM